MLITVIIWVVDRIITYTSGVTKPNSRQIQYPPRKRAQNPTVHADSARKSLCKDKISEEASKGVVYKIKCKDCACDYVGQTSSPLKTRVNGNAEAITFSIAEHQMLHQHEIRSQNVLTLFTDHPAWKQRLFFEAWHSVGDKMY